MVKTLINFVLLSKFFYPVKYKTPGNSSMPIQVMILKFNTSNAIPSNVFSTLHLQKMICKAGIESFKCFFPFFSSVESVSGKINFSRNRIFCISAHKASYAERL